MINRLDLTLDQIYRLGSKGSEELQTALDKVYNSTPLGPLPSNLVNTVYGINHRQTQLALPFNRDGYGLTLFTRPRLNLSTDNIRFVRQMYPLLNTESKSTQRIIRALLDPEAAFPDQENTKLKPINSPYVDDLNVFIPMLSNLCLTIAGWNDFVVDTRTTPEGHYRESHSMVDSSVLIKNTFELSATFRNVPNNPITLLFYFWILYASKVFEGELLPYGSAIYENEIDYNTRIWRLVVDPTKRYVQHILSTGASFPLNAPVGTLGNFDSTQPYNDANDTVNIRFQCIGMDYNDPIQVTEFNQAVTIFNPGMDNKFRDQYYIKIPYQILSFFNMRGYPRINPSDMELEWYVSYAMFNTYLKQIEDFTQISGLRDKRFLAYLNPAKSKDYKEALLELDSTIPNDTMNGGVIKSMADEYSDEEIEDMALRYNARVGDYDE